MKHLRINKDGEVGSSAHNHSAIADTSTESGFHLGRYVRDLSLKARNLVGGFLRKEESTSTHTSIRSNMKASNTNSQEKWKFQHVSY
jgi:hypothetical protein